MQAVRDMSRECPSGSREDFDRPAVIIHVGAGNCRELDRYAASQAKRIVLVEADPVRAKELSRRTDDMPGVEVLPFAVGGISGKGKFKVFNLSDWNSLHTPIGLKGLFPGLRLLRETEVETVSVLDLIEQVGLEADESNWLVIDAPGSEMTILEPLCSSGRLGCFDSIVLHCGKEPLYEGSASADAILPLLRQHGYETTASVSGDDPDLVCRTLRLSPFKAECAALQEQVQSLSIERGKQSELVDQLRNELHNLSRDYEDANRRLDDDHSRLESVSSELADYRRQVSELRQTLESMISDRDAREEQYRMEIGELQRICHERDIEVSGLRAESARLSRDYDDREKLAGELRQKLGQALAGYEERGTRLREQQAILDGISSAHGERAGLAAEHGALLQRLLESSNQNAADLLDITRTYEKRFDDLEKGVKKDLIRAISNSTRQIESRIGIESYLGRGHAVPAMGGWAASADISLFLIRLIASRSYDLIIEFGSGISTVLMASILRDDRSAEMPSWPNRSLSGAADPVPRMVAFEHQRKYFDETIENLLQAGVAEYVEMNYAPLRNYSTAHDEHFLYYACEERIAELSRLLKGRRGRILVFVDGPPGSTGRHARYPALPIVLQHLSGHELDILLDDYGREDEKSIAKRWEEMLSERSLAWRKEVLEFEKGAVLLTVS